MTVQPGPFADRTGWPPGPWDGEEDGDRWVDDETGVLCMFIRAQSCGYLLGYVAVDPGHPWFGLPWERIEARGGDPPPIHGGLNYADHKDGDPALWWVGFDCDHASDLRPAGDSWMRLRRPGATYKTVAFVRAECRRLAAMAREAT